MSPSWLTWLHAFRGDSACARSSDDRSVNEQLLGPLDPHAWFHAASENGKRMGAAPAPEAIPEEVGAEPAATAAGRMTGEVLVARKLSLEVLPSSAFGGPRTTKLMIHVTWRLTTIAFLTVGSALLLSGSVLHGDTARGIGVVGRRLNRLRCDRGGANGGLHAVPSIPVPPPRSHPTLDRLK